MHRASAVFTHSPRLISSVSATNCCSLRRVHSSFAFLSFFHPFFLPYAGSPFPDTPITPSSRTIKLCNLCFFSNPPAIPSILGNRARRMSFFSRKKHPSASQLAASVTVAQTPSQALAQLGAKEPPHQPNDV